MFKSATVAVIAALSLVPSIHSPVETVSDSSTTHGIQTVFTAAHTLPTIDGNRKLSDEDQKNVSPNTHMTPVDDRDKVFTIPNYPRVSRSTGCTRAKVGKMTFTIAFGGLICAPLSIVTSPGVGFACGKVGQIASSYITWDTVC